MKTAVRYYSKSGRTEKIARAIARGAETDACSVTQEPALKEKVDILFLGGAPYANIMAPELKEYAENLSPDKVGKVILFTTSNWSRRTVIALKKSLKKKGINVSDNSFYAQAAMIDKRLFDAENFGKEMILE